jgi:hypothetical protein
LIPGKAKGFFSSPKHPYFVWYKSGLQVIGYWGIFPIALKAWGIKLTTSLMLRIRMIFQNSVNNNP